MDVITCVGSLATPEQTNMPALTRAAVCWWEIKLLGGCRASASYSGGCTAELLSWTWTWACGNEKQRKHNQFVRGASSVWSPKVQDVCVCVCVDHHLHWRLGQQSLPEDYFGKDCPPPPTTTTATATTNTVVLAAAEADTVFIHSAQHRGEESIETVVTAGRHRESELSLEWSSWNSKNWRPGAGWVSARLDPTVAIIQFFFLFNGLGGILFGRFKLWLARWHSSG